jgi:sterol desaturase/sphingolipid hydroxylase (fatty acid hydroxylase superfamily)
MALLDFSVRPQGAKPPLSQPFVLGDRISFLLLAHTMTILIFYLHFFRAYGLPAFALYIAIENCWCMLETMMSNRYGRCIENIRKAGYTDTTILFYQEFNRIASQALAFILVNFITTDEYIYTWDYLTKSFGLSQVAKIAVNLTVTEILFFAGHRLMHTHPAFIKLHVFHHCSVEPSFNTNLLFHPIDLAIEFAAPALSLLVLHFGIWHDEGVLLYTYVLFQLWYAYDHDENLSLYHTQHHKKCDSLYVIYSNIKDSGKDNILKQYMVEHGLIFRKNQ